MTSRGNLLHIRIRRARKRLARHRDIVERMRTFARDLHLLVAFAREQHDVAGARFRDRQRNRFAAVDFHAVFHAGPLQAHQRVIDDGPRIFAARIVGSEHDEIAASPRRLAHQRTLGAIAIAAATEHRQHSRRPAAARDELAGQRREIAQRVVGVGVVDDHRERLAAVDALKSSRDMRERLNAARNRSRFASARKACGRRGQDVVHIHPPDQRRENWNCSRCGVAMSKRVPRGLMSTFSA